MLVFQNLMCLVLVLGQYMNMCTTQMRRLAFIATATLRRSPPPPPPSSDIEYPIVQSGARSCMFYSYLVALSCCLSCYHCLSVATLLSYVYLYMFHLCPTIVHRYLLTLVGRRSRNHTLQVCSRPIDGCYS